MRKIVFTGGGSAGHVVPNIALIEELRGKYELFYVGTDGIEKRLLSPYLLPFYTISCPKFIRGFSLENLSIPKRFLKAEKEATDALNRIRPDLVFSKGGYVALPVVFAAKRLGIPCITHESDLSVGLANRLMARKCKYLLTSFEDTAKAFKNGRYTGSPMRGELFIGNRRSALNKYGFSGKKKVLLSFGGGSGSELLNSALRENLSALTEEYDVLHLTGKGKAVSSTFSGYRQVEYEPDMASAYAVADAVICRAGSNTVFELLALKKKALLIPLDNGRTRGDQVKNAEYFHRKGLAHILYERQAEMYYYAVKELLADGELDKKLTACKITSGNEMIIRYIESCL